MRAVGWIVLIALLPGVCALGAEGNTGENDALQSGVFQWTTGAVKVQPKPNASEDWHAIKDPSIVRYGDRWHLFCTVRGTQRSHAIVYASFEDWDHAADAKQTVLGCSTGYFCAPQVFYFRPQEQWYLICQASDESWEPKYQASYSTSKDISDPSGWSPLRPLGARQADGKSGLDFWIICDDEKAHLFFTTLDGRMWREETKLADFPGGWSEAQLAIKGDIFEASHTYRIAGRQQYLTVVEAQNGFGWRYFKAYTTDRLDGVWTPLAAEKDLAFASMRNVEQSAGHWTGVVSHGELLRAAYDETLAVDPAPLRAVFQGVLEKDRAGLGYGQIPWKLGLLEQVVEGE